MKVLPVSLIATELLSMLLLTTVLAAGPCDPEKHSLAVSRSTLVSTNMDGEEFYQVKGFNAGHCKEEIWTVDAHSPLSCPIKIQGGAILLCGDNGGYQWHHPDKGTAICEKSTFNVPEVCTLAKTFQISHCCGKPDGKPDSRRWLPGWCGVHVRQVQKTKRNKDYILEAWIKDAGGKEIGKTTGGQDAPAGVGVRVKSELPQAFIITTQNVDQDPLLFAYGDRIWDSDDGACSVGVYANDERHMDCGFTCDY